MSQLFRINGRCGSAFRPATVPGKTLSERTLNVPNRSYSSPPHQGCAIHIHYFNLVSVVIPPRVTASIDQASRQIVYLRFPGR
uniref:Uncharacterized protein n=1 Tax=Anguilla anguilla TaxID=7936 RepID=A0A0E9P8V7_ANGAN